MQRYSRYSPHERQSRKNQHWAGVRNRSVILRSRKVTLRGNRDKNQCQATTQNQALRKLQEQPYEICFLAIRGHCFSEHRDSSECIEQAILKCREAWTAGIPLLDSATSAVEHLLLDYDRLLIGDDGSGDDPTPGIHQDGATRDRGSGIENCEPAISLLMMAVSQNDMMDLLRRRIVSRCGSRHGSFGEGWVWRYPKDFTRIHHRVHTYTSASQALVDTRKMDGEGIVLVARGYTGVGDTTEQRLEAFGRQEWRQKVWHQWCSDCGRTHAVLRS